MEDGLLVLKQIVVIVATFTPMISLPESLQAL
jgi:hypothetical protein